MIQQPVEYGRRPMDTDERLQLRLETSEDLSWWLELDVEEECEED